MGGGQASSALFHLFRLAFRLLLFLGVVAIGVWIYLSLRVGMQDFSKQLTAAVGQSLDASQAKVEDASRKNGELGIRHVACAGGPDAFFDSLDAVNIRCKMGLLDGLTGVWNPGQVVVNRLDITVRAGADDAESAVKRTEAFLRSFPKFDVRNVEIPDATIRWGYSDRTRGVIENSHLSAQRVDGGWRMQFHGGKFSQSWLHKLDIVELVVVADSRGLHIEKGELATRVGDQPGSAGGVSLQGVTVSSSDRPVLAGVVRFKRVALESLIPERMQGFLEGRISGDLRLSGSTNSTDGIGLEGHIVLEGDDYITLRDRFHLLRALTSIGVFNSYRKVDFRDGSFSMKTGAGSLELRDVNLKANEAMTLQGRVKVRPPTKAEIENAISSRPSGELSPIFATDNQDVDRSSEKTDFSLRRAAAEDLKAAKEKDAAPSADGGIFARMAQGQIDNRKLEEEGADAFSRALRYEGALRVTIPGDAFDRSPDLRALYSPEPSTGRIAIDVPIAGGLYEITLKQAEEIYQKGRRRE